MRKICLIFSLLIVTFNCTFSQNSIHGKISDKETKESLPAVILYFSELKIGTLTDTAGNFQFPSIPKGNFMMEVRFLGYESKIIAVNAAEKKEYNIQLSQSATEMQEVVITGVSASTERMINPIPSIPVRKDFLLRSSSTNIIDGIARLPGVDQITTGSSISKPVVRGLSYNRVVVLVDGMKHEGQQWGDEHGIEVDENTIDKAEIIKGPGSLMYGSDAMAGVINFIGLSPLPKGLIKGEFSTQYQSNSGLLNTSLMNTGSLRDFYWLARISAKKAGDYSNARDGKVFNSGVEELDGSGMLGIRKKWGYSQLGFSSFNQKLGLVEGNRDSLGHFIKQIKLNDTTSEDITLYDSDMKGYQNSIANPDQKIAHSRLSWINSLQMGAARLETSLSWQENIRKEYGDVLKPDVVGLFFKQQTYLANLCVFLPTVRQWKISTGISTEIKNNKNLGNEFLIPAFHSAGTGVFVVFQKKIRAVFFSGGVRYDYNQIDSKALYLDENGKQYESQVAGTYQKFKAFKRDYQNVSGSLGVSVSLRDDLVGRLNVSKGFRSPNPAELGSNGIHEGTFHYEIGNPDLKPESSLQFDGGITLNRHHITVDINGFVNNIDNYIYPERLLLWFNTFPFPWGYGTYLFTQGNAVLYGGEASVDIHPHPIDWLHIENSFSYVIGEHKNQTGADKYLPFIPAARLQSEIRVQLPKAKGHFQAAYAEIGGTYYFKQDKVDAAFGTESPTPDYFLLKAGLGSDFLNKGNKVVCRIFISADNIMDIVYQSHLSRLKYGPYNFYTGKQGVYNPGRNLTLKLIIPF